ncbi:hypothetical protein J4U01_gp095 [Mycobacterium phage Kumao]|uniref:Uncharacterized protein n=1 Tax=Mycobacterium phage Kumao TaxID=2041344 RepID=A0A2D1GQ50_9CAUD|nr:hypothetical protein J4U01_gp095 [Mycobacterium phage Kumao]ATN94063.1 hypothetical protein SEA_KUMAO_101 [Mycobacterium phage Kumao]
MAAMNEREVPCQWHEGCPLTAKTTRWHPTLGQVPICHNCNQWLDRKPA